MRIVRVVSLATLLLSAPLVLGQQSRPPLYRFRVRKPIASASVALSTQQLSSLDAAGFKILEDYGPFAVIEGLRSDVASLQAATGLAFDPLEDAFSVELAGTRIDTSPGAAAPTLDPDLTLADYDGPTGLYLVQFHAPMRPEWIEPLAAAGARLVQYVGSNAYAVAAPAGLKSLRAALGGTIQYVGVFQPALKLDPELRAATEGLNELLAFNVILDGGQDLSATVAALGADVEPQLDGSLGLQILHTTATAAQARALAKQSPVLWIERVAPGGVSDERVDQYLLPNNGGGAGQYATTLANSYGLGVAALSTEIVDVQDTGIQLSNVPNRQSTSCITPAANQTGHADLNNSLNYARLAYACPSDPAANANIDDGFGHGSLVASIIAGRPTQSGGAATFLTWPDSAQDANGFYWNMGVAPGVRIGSTKLWDDNQNLFQNHQTFEALAAAAYTRGARYQNASWNFYTSAYTGESFSFDKVVRTAGMGDESHSMNVIVSAGNTSHLRAVQTPATAKNVISVGASGVVRGLVGACSSSIGIGDIAAISSRGAAYNGSLFKPDLVAPGQVVIGAALPLGRINECSGTTSPLVPDQAPYAGNIYYAGNGTSYSAPQVTGAAVLVRKTLGAVAPSLVKAALIANAESMHGGSDWGNGGVALGWEPTNVQGWGRLSLKRFFDGTPRVFYSENPSWAFTAAGQWRDLTLTVGDPTKPVLVALAWTDPPGFQGPNPLVNSIGLYVYSGSNNWCDGLGYYGSQYHTPTSMCYLPPDQVNNVKMIRIAPNTFPANGQFTIHLYALNVTTGPGPGGSPYQDWSAYVYNAR